MKSYSHYYPNLNSRPFQNKRGEQPPVRYGEEQFWRSNGGVGIVSLATSQPVRQDQPGLQLSILNLERHNSISRKTTLYHSQFFSPLEKVHDCFQGTFEVDVNDVNAVVNYPISLQTILLRSTRRRINRSAKPNFTWKPFGSHPSNKLLVGECFNR